MTEVFFPNRFTVDKHSGKAPDMFPNYPEELNGISVPIEYLTHVTHDKKASEIFQDGYFEFKARKKFGKTRAYDGSPCGESLRPSQVNVGYFQITDKFFRVIIHGGVYTLSIPHFLMISSEGWIESKKNNVLPLLFQITST